MPNPRLRPQSMSLPPYGTRLADVLEARVELHAWCSGCGRLTPLDRQRLAKRSNTFLRLDDMARHLTCKTELCPGGEAAFYIREADYAQIKRYR